MIGILLKRLEEDPFLKNITHVFVDEVHERSIESDFLLMVLKDLIPKRLSTQGSFNFSSAQLYTRDCDRGGWFLQGRSR